MDNTFLTQITNGIIEEVETAEIAPLCLSLTMIALTVTVQTR